MKKLIIGAVYKHKSKGIVWEVIGGMELKCLYNGEVRYEIGKKLTISDYDSIFTDTNRWIIIPPFDKYYEATNK